MKQVLIVAFLALTCCQAQPDIAAKDEIAPSGFVFTPAPTEEPPAPKPKLKHTVAAQDFDTDGMPSARPKLAVAARCFVDYCPCDTKDPDYGGADVSICRSLNGGVPVPDDIMAGAASMRDARRMLREDRQNNPTRGYR